MRKKEERQHIILHEVSIHNRVLLADLAEAMQVSVDTVRRDVKELDEANKLKKVHGGAVSLAYQQGRKTNGNGLYAAEQKIKIANKAAALIRPNQVVLISGGTTNLELVRALPQDLHATFFTPSLPIALELAAHPEIEVIQIGGKLSDAAQIVVGAAALNMLSDIRVDLCFLGTGYLHQEYGLTEFDWEVAQIKRAMIRTARKVVLLTISEKLATSQRCKVCDIQDIDTMVTELPPDAAALEAFRVQGIRLV